MKILIIGNGFDLEHGLPTRYTDFLEFLSDLDQNSVQEPSLDNVNIWQACRYIDSILGSKNSEINNVIRVLTADNAWVTYFQKSLEDHLKNKENWIDFEYEISSVIQSMEFIIKFYKKTINEESEYNSLSYEQCMERLLRIIPDYVRTEQEIKSRIPYLVNDLCRLVSALEIYIWNHIDLSKIQYYNPDISEIRPDKIISFNYSDTYRRLYDTDNSNLEYHYIHGKAKNNISFLDENEFSIDYESIKMITEESNMVLGIDEYLPQERRNKEINFIQFKKYYQRIYKQTGNGYKQWLRQIDASGVEKDNILYIFGHSLDVTDGDILSDIINHDRIKTVIFYKDKKQLGQQIANLVKILGSDSLIYRVEGTNPSIVFRHQSNRERIDGSAFEIAMDTIHLENIYKATRKEAEQLISKIDKKIRENNYKYFFSQESVIKLFVMLLKNGLGNKYENELLEIAKKLLNNDKLRKPKQFSYEQWDYQNFNNVYDEKLKNFMDVINTFNKDSFSSHKKETDGFDEELKKYVRLIDDNASISKMQYIEIIQRIFRMIEFEENKSEKRWEILVNVSAYSARNIFEKTLLELMENSKDIYDTIRYNRLLSDTKRMQIVSIIGKK